MYKSIVINHICELCKLHGHMTSGGHFEFDATHWVCKASEDPASLYAKECLEIETNQLQSRIKVIN